MRWQINLQQTLYSATRQRLHSHQYGGLSCLSIQPIDVPRSRRKEAQSPCTAEELSELRRLAGELNYIAHSVLSPAFFAARELLKRFSSLTVSDLIFANNCLRSLQKVKVTIQYNRQYQPLHSPQYLTFADASLGKTVYGQTGYISGLHVPGDNSFYALDLTSHEQSRIYVFLLWAQWPTPSIVAC